MGKTKKVIRSKYVYKKQTHRVRNTILFGILILLLVGLGYIFSKEWAKRFGPGAPPPSSEPESSLPLSSESVSSESVSSTPASSEETSSEAVARATLHGRVLTLEEAQKTGAELDTLLQSIKDAGYTAVVVDLKTEDGSVTFDSTNVFAREWGTVSPTPIALEPLVSALKNANLTPLARISALKDSTAHVSKKNSFGYENNPEVNWMDNRADLGGKPWLNPYMENARNYISGLCGEAAGRGFAGILLTNVNFPITPYQTKMGLLNETTTRDGILEQLMAECQVATATIPVYNAYNAAWTAVQHAVDGLPLPRKLTAGDSQSPILDLDALAASKETICNSYGIANQNGYDPAISAATVAEGLLLATNPDGFTNCLPLIRLQDEATLKPMFEKMGIQSWIVVS